MPVSAAAQKIARQRRRTPTFFQGVDLEQEAGRYCQALGYVRNVELRVKHSAAPGTGGYQWLMVTTLTIGSDAALATALQVLLHEISHIEFPNNHSEAFIQHMVELSQRCWGLDLAGWEQVPRGAHKCRAYAVDQFIRERLAPRLAAGLYIPAQTP